MLQKYNLTTVSFEHNPMHLKSDDKLGEISEKVNFLV